MNWPITSNARALARIEAKLDRLLWAAQREKERDKMAQKDIEQIRVSVEKNKEVATSAVTLINGLAQQIRDLADDPAELQALAAELESNAAALGQAVEANTPAA